MPIRKEMKSKYPPRKEWLAIRTRILARAKNCCEFCGVHNHRLGYRDEDGKFRAVMPMECEALALDGVKTLRIVLTVAHLDHDPTNNADNNLRALCQRCHLRYDAKEHRYNAAETRGKRRAKSLQFPEARHA